MNVFNSMPRFLSKVGLFFPCQPYHEEFSQELMGREMLSTREQPEPAAAATEKEKKEGKKGEKG